MSATESDGQPASKRPPVTEASADTAGAGEEPASKVSDTAAEAPAKRVKGEDGAQANGQEPATSTAAVPVTTSATAGTAMGTSTTTATNSSSSSTGPAGAAAAAPTGTSSGFAASGSLFSNFKPTLGGSNNFLKAWGSGGSGGLSTGGSWSLSGGGLTGSSGTGFGGLLAQSASASSAAPSTSTAATTEAAATTTSASASTPSKPATGFGLVAQQAGSAFASNSSGSTAFSGLGGGKARESIFGNAVAQAGKSAGLAAIDDKDKRALAEVKQQNTGEESEHKVFQTKAKLYCFENGSWHERGAGILSLNDEARNKKDNSRLVMRVEMTKKLCLNAPLAAARNINHASSKTIIAIFVNYAASDALPKHYTIKAAAPAIQDLFQAIKDRVPASSLAAEKSEDDSAEAWSDTPATTGASTPASASASVAAPAATPASSSAASTTEAKPADS